MARGNPDKLVPIQSAVEAREKGRNGGKKSGESRRLKKSLRERLNLILEGKTNGMEVADAITMALIEKALTGDTRAYEIIRDTIGEKPTNKGQMEQTGELRIVWTEQQ